MLNLYIPMHEMQCLVLALHKECILCVILTALLEQRTALLEYTDLFVLDVLIYSSMIYCTSNQDLQV